MTFPAMRPRNLLVDKLTQLMPLEVANALVDGFAHGLAEQQRYELLSDGYTPRCVCGGCSWCLAQDYINLIDPWKGASGE